MFDSTDPDELRAIFSSEMLVISGSRLHKVAASDYQSEVCVSDMHRQDISNQSGQSSMKLSLCLEEGMQVGLQLASICTGLIGIDFRSPDLG